MESQCEKSSINKAANKKKDKDLQIFQDKLKYDPLGEENKKTHHDKGSQDQTVAIQNQAKGSVQRQKEKDNPQHTKREAHMDITIIILIQTM